MSLETLLKSIGNVELSGQRLDAVISDYCKHYEIDPSVFDGAIRTFAHKAIADVVIASQLAAITDEKVDFNAMLIEMKFGEEDPSLAELQQRLLDNYREPIILAVSRGLYDRRLSSMLKWIKRARPE